MLTIEALENYGANTKEGLERCLNKEDFYLMLIPQAVERSAYERVDNAIKAGNLEEGFEAAHALKGILANLALTPALKPVSEMTELLRAKNAEADYDSLLKEMWSERDRLEALL